MMVLVFRMKIKKRYLRNLNVPPLQEEVVKVELRDLAWD